MLLLLRHLLWELELVAVGRHVRHLTLHLLKILHLLLLWYHAHVDILLMGCGNLLLLLL
jgi:hypothetical protein